MDEKLALVMIPQALSAWLCDIAERMGVSLEAVSTTALAAIAAVIGRKLAIMPKSDDDEWLVLPVLWQMLVARPGQKKTPTYSEVLRPIKLLEADARQKFEEAQAASLAAQSVLEIKINEVKSQLKLAAKNGDESKCQQLQSQLEVLEREVKNTHVSEKRYKTNDATVEKLADLLIKNPNGLLLLRDELSGWLYGFEKQGREGDREFFLEAWNGRGGFSVDRIGRGSIHVPALLMNVMGGIQPGKLEQYVSASARGGGGDDGLLQRFQLAVYPEKRAFRYVDRAGNKEAREAAFKIFQRLDSFIPDFLDEVKTEGELPSLRFDREGQSLFNSWILALEKRLHDGALEPIMEAHLAKYRSLMPAIALVLHLTEWAGGESHDLSPVSGDAAKMAIAWCDFLEGHAKKIYSYALHSDIYSARALAKKIESGDVRDGDNVRSIYRRGWSHLTRSEDVSAACAVLEQRGWIRCDGVPTQGGPSTLIRLNPSLKRPSDL